MRFFCEAEDGIRVLVRARGLGEVYKGQEEAWASFVGVVETMYAHAGTPAQGLAQRRGKVKMQRPNAALMPDGDTANKCIVSAKASKAAWWLAVATWDRKLCRHTVGPRTSKNAHLFEKRDDALLVRLSSARFA